LQVETTSRPTGESTGRYRGLAPLDQTRSTLSDRVGSIRTQVRHLDGDTRVLHEQTYSDDLDQRCRELSKVSVSELLGKLNELGFAWRDVARMVGVSVPALQKWRRGEKITGENRLKLAKVLAIVETVQTDMMVVDPASWFEIPIQEGVQLTPIDLVAAAMPALVFDLANDHDHPEGILDRFDKNWRDTLTDSSFETFVAADGVRSIRPKG
jgi:transcriptional regulator with XRE-family HTH domain